MSSFTILLILSQRAFAPFRFSLLRFVAQSLHFRSNDSFAHFVLRFPSPKTEILLHLVVTEHFMCLYLWVTRLSYMASFFSPLCWFPFFLSIHKCLSKQHCICDNKVFLHALIYAYICFVSHWTGALNQIISKRWKFVIKHYTLFIPIALYAIRVRFTLTHSLFSSSILFVCHTVTHSLPGSAPLEFGHFTFHLAVSLKYFCDI